MVVVSTWQSDKMAPQQPENPASVIAAILDAMGGRLAGNFRDRNAAAGGPEGSTVRVALMIG
jgi:hypothetical protein